MLEEKIAAQAGDGRGKHIQVSGSTWAKLKEISKVTGTTMGNIIDVVVEEINVEKIKQIKQKGSEV